MLLILENTHILRSVISETFVGLYSFFFISFLRTIKEKKMIEKRKTGEKQSVFFFSNCME